MDSPSQILRRRGLKPKRSWGQNFLQDRQALERIAAAVELDPSEAVVELGAGLGHLTRFLLASGARVIAVEREADMLQVLNEQRDPKLEVVAANAAKIDFAGIAQVARVAVIGNLPYHLTSPILFQVISQRARISRAVFTVQREVADRLASPPGGRAYGILTVLLGLYFDVEKLFELPRALFHPPPRVDSAVIRLRALSIPRAVILEDARFRRVVKAAFAQRRKTLINSLRSDPALGSADSLREALMRSGIDPTRRAETLSVAEFAQLERALAEIPLA